ncbi:hypothetical protein C8J57DRAFT_1362127 [Mycena rebaudengoi]|nr:hypothetical protein C8J57DRAFT_1362127 [Mycena rebaudengoi]
MSTIEDARVLLGDPNGLFCSGDTLKLRTLARGENGFTAGGGVPMLGVRNERLRGVTGGELPGVPWCGIWAAVLAWWASRRKPGLGGSLSSVFIPLPMPLTDPMARRGGYNSKPRAQSTLLSMKKGTAAKRLIRVRPSESAEAWMIQCRGGLITHSRSE